MKKVLFIQRYLPHFRKEFFDGLKKSCEASNIHLDLVSSKIYGKDSGKIKEIDLEWGITVPLTIFQFLGQTFYWQKEVNQLGKYNLIILQQSNRDLLNWFFLLFRKRHTNKLAFIGHGRNMQSSQSSLGNKIKRFFINQVDAWFAYNENVSKYLLENGVPNIKITSFDNTIDTKQLIDSYESVTEDELRALKEEMDILSDNIAIYCGGLYQEKRLDFLIKSCHLIKKKVDDFHLVILGNGPERNKVEQAAAMHTWIHYIGGKYDFFNKAKYFKISKILLNPGLVGLVILDSFATMTPLVTTNYPYHSPEIAYLKNRENGVMTENNIEAYSENVIRILLQDHELKNLENGCKKAREMYTMENSISKFMNGIERLLKTEIQ